MKVVNAVKPDTTFESIPAGTCFESASKCYIKVESGHEAVEFLTGKITRFGGFEKVTPHYNAEVTLR